MTSSTTPDPTRCPLCGQPNQCAMEAPLANARDPSPCWCTTVKIEPSLLAQIPRAARGQACVCRACATTGKTPT